MTQLEPNEDLYRTLQDKVAVVTGGATGIGRAVIEQFVHHGAKVAFGDVNDVESQNLLSRLGPDNAIYSHCDASSYTDQLRLFAAAEAKFGRVDIAVGNAGIVIPLDPYMADSDVTQEPPMGEIEVNLKGAIFTSRIAAHYLRRSGGGDIVLTSSISGFKESGGLPIYTASKHGIVGIVRGANLNLIKEDIRINVVCPWMTKTAMSAAISEGWYRLQLPTNEAADVATSILICATANRSDNAEETHINADLPFAGKILWVGGGKTFEIEDRIQALEPQWLGSENSKELKKGQTYLASLDPHAEI
ncbi:15-hydroxyprostaglandin dehydrogenase [Penicillium verhagenii]|nr:15-hydroxyprostaglandin dehydrogenase [Penicillium verhagenii]